MESSLKIEIEVVSIVLLLYSKIIKKSNKGYEHSFPLCIKLVKK
jgi:hypothetical protein